MEVSSTIFFLNVYPFKNIKIQFREIAIITLTKKK